MDSKPLLTVCVITYQHEKYIEQCLRSIVEQQTDFDVQVLVGDDGSTDGTAAICKQYAEQYPDNIELFVHDREATERESYTGCPGSYNFIKLLQAVKGEYIALCEGDDYWVDPQKLQLQIDFLREHPLFSACYHATLVENKDGIGRSGLNNLAEDVLTLAELAHGNRIHTPSIVYRNVFDDPLPEFVKTAPVLDYLLHCFAAEKGNIKYINREMAVYRVHDEGYWSPMPDKIRMQRWLEVLWPLTSHFRNIEVKHNFANQFFICSLQWMRAANEDDEDFRKLLLSQLAELDSQGMAALLSGRLEQQNSKLTGMEQPDEMTGRFQQAREIVGGNLYDLAVSIARNTNNSLVGGLEKNRFYLDVATLIFHDAEIQLKEDPQQWDKSLQFRENLESGEKIARKILDLPHLHDDAWDLIEQYKRLDAACHYQNWFKRHTLQEIDGQLFAERMSLEWQKHPKFHLAVMLFPGEEELLADTLDSLGQQMYQNWQLTVLSDSPAPDPLWNELDALNWVELGVNENPYECLNQQLTDLDADWVGFISPGISLEPQALVQLGDYINIRPDWKMIYTDEDTLDNKGQRIDPRFNPEFNLDFLRSKPYINNFCIFEKRSFVQIGGFKPLVSAENYDLTLRIHDQDGASVIGHVSEVLVHTSAISLRTCNSEMIKSALLNHLDRNEQIGTIEDGYVKGTNRVVYQHAGQPGVSIVIPSRDKLEYIQPCIESIVDKTVYPGYEIIIVDNNSSDPDTLAYYEKLKSRADISLQIATYPQAFNFSAMCNIGVDHASSEYIVFLNNDTKIIQGEWLSRMMSHGQRNDVGVVGARLVFPETGKIQHAGMLLGLHGVSEFPFSESYFKESSYMDRSHVDQNYSAVSAACMLVKRSVYDKVGRMDEQRFSVAFNDVDLCLKVSDAGYKVVWTPYALLIHHGSATQTANMADIEKFSKFTQRLKSEKDNVIFKWGEKLASDPSYNPNLSLSRNDFRAELSIPRNWDVNFHGRVRIFGVPVSGGSGDYRVVQPFEAISQAGLAQCEYYHLGNSIKQKPNISELLRLQADVIVVQAAIDDVQMGLLEDIDKYMPEVFRIFTVDDLITEIPEKNSSFKNAKKYFSDAKTRLRKALSLCNRLIVSTQPLADYCADLIDDIQVVPNRLSRDRWLGLNSLRGQSEKPRVGWVGAQQHQGDLELIYDVVKATADEFDWVFMGMSPDEIKPYIKESHDFVSIDKYPAKMASLNLDIAIAPLEVNAFNESKSNLRLLEYGVFGWPVICTDIYPYRTDNAPVKRIENNVDTWIATLREYGNDQALREQAGDRLKEWVLEHYIQEDHVDSLYQSFIRNEEVQFQEQSSIAPQIESTESN